MTVIHAIILGAIQGIAEFLPISSSGHLALGAIFFGQQDVPLLFDILLHVATLCAVCLVMRKQIVRLFLVAFRFCLRKARKEDAQDEKLILAVLTGTFVTALIGFALKDLVSDLSPFWISCALVVTGIILLISGRIKERPVAVVPGPLQGIIVGISQGFGVIPGISRAGSTISMSLFAGLDRKTAGEFSFLLSIPAILGAFILELKDADTLSGSISIFALVAGMVTAFIVGYISLRFLLRVINKGKLYWFALYLIPAGSVLAVYFFNR